MRTSRLEHSFNPNDGTAVDADRFFDAQATVGLSSREWGRVDLGLMDQPAVVLLREADPWRGNTSATPGLRAYLPPTRDATRSAGAATYSTPAQWDWQFSLQTGRPEPERELSYRTGFSLAWDHKPWLAGVGWQEWNDGSRAMPLVLVHDSGSLRIGSAVTFGRAQHDEYRNVYVNASGPLMGKGDPWRHEWRIGLNRFDGDGALGSDWKLGAGWRYRLSRRVVLMADAALVRPQGGAMQTAFDFGLSYSFARDLRLPQEPW